MSGSTNPVTQVAKKPHRCSWCGDQIDAGEKYTRWRWFDDGDAGTIKMHQECNTAFDVDAQAGNNTFDLYDNERGERSDAA